MDDTTRKAICPLFDASYIRHICSIETPTRNNDGVEVLKKDYQPNETFKMWPRTSFRQVALRVLFFVETSSLTVSVHPISSPLGLKLFSTSSTRVL
jgi:hypothetical protein